MGRELTAVNKSWKASWGFPLTVSAGQGGVQVFREALTVSPGRCHWGQRTHHVPAPRKHLNPVEVQGIGSPLSGLERVKQKKKQISLKNRKHHKAFRECIVYSISQVSPFPVSPIVFSLIKYILLNCIFLLGLILYSDKIRL